MLTRARRLCCRVAPGREPRRDSRRPSGIASRRAFMGQPPIEDNPDAGGSLGLLSRRCVDRERGPGGSWELLRIAAPLVLSSSFFTIQLTVDRLMLAQQSSTAVGAAMSAAVWYWTPLALLQFTAMYASTFVAQYVGAGRKERVGPAVWQSTYVAVTTGLAFLLIIPLVRSVIALVVHAPEVQELEAQYMECLCFWTLPILLVASVNAFFSGRGETWRVLITDGIGAAGAVVLCYVLINGHWGFPALGIRGAAWAMVGGAWLAFAIGLAMMMQSKFRREFNTLAGWRPDLDLFRRMMRFGLPSGAQYSLEALAFSVFLMMVGHLGTAQLSATSIAF